MPFWGSELITPTSEIDVNFLCFYGPLVHARYPGVFDLISGASPAREGLGFVFRFEGAEVVAGSD